MSSNIEVWRIDKFSGSNNEYGVDRSENWVWNRDSFHDSIEDAKDHIRMKSKMFTDLPLFLVDLKTDEEKVAAIDEFCFTDKYIKDFSLENLMLTRLKNL